MRRNSSSFYFPVLALTVAGCSPVPPAADPGRVGLEPVVIAHRGFSARAPEHTLAAYDLAVAAGADYIEQDLQLTSDGVLVVLHDPTLERTVRGPAEHCAGEVIQKTLQQLLQCDAGSWFNQARPTRARAEFQAQRIPTLEQVFERYGHTVRYYIETKNPEEAPGMEEELLRLLREHQLIGDHAGRPRVLVQSFSDRSLQKLHALEPDLPLVLLFGRLPSAEIRDSLPSVRDYVVGIGPHFSSVDRELVQAAGAMGIGIHPYTVNEVDEMNRLYDLAVDGFFTDDPEQALEVRVRRR